MQTLDVISINFWQILISLCNLLILFVVLKKFLYKPVMRAMEARQADIDTQYRAADEAQQAAEQNRRVWEAKMQEAEADADALLKKATATADRRGEKIVSEARDKADDIIRDAQAQAALEHKKAQAGIKKEIVDVSMAITEKVLGREINTEDHHAMIDAVISEIGETHDGDQ